ncbi:hypothetical protein LINPERHAP1_LOCUS17357 [Linum perenne]
MANNFFLVRFAQEEDYLTAAFGGHGKSTIIILRLINGLRRLMRMIRSNQSSHGLGCRSSRFIFSTRWR